jgi:hypothetical protein
MRIALAAGLLAALTVSAAADDKKPTPAPAQPAVAEKTPDLTKLQGSECAKARAQNKTCVISIENEDILGETATGDGTALTGIEFPTHASLVRIRLHFLPEIIRSTEDL